MGKHTKTLQSVANIVRVTVARNIPMMLDYKWKGDTQSNIGQFVEVPVGSKFYAGVVTEILDKSPFQSLKDAVPIADILPLALPTNNFYRWVARYNLNAPGDPLRASLPKNKVPTKPKVEAENLPLIQPNLVTLNQHQKQAESEINRAKNFQPFLLDGVTGSGKTEVYFHVIAKILAENKTAQVLILVPEIALTPQWLARFESSFGFKPITWHAQIKDKAKKEAWWQVHNGKAQVVVGARSAMFLPFRNLKFVVVDEEHDPAYKQDEMFRYHGRDMAVSLASHWDCPVILASATPSLETWNNALVGKYQHLILPNRHGEQELPQIKLLDLKTENGEKNTFISPNLRAEILATIEGGQQVLLFLNRRGNAPLLICGSCGHRRDCPRCSATLTVHGNRLICHYCGLAEPWPKGCHECEEEGGFKAYGPGTRGLMQEVETFAPHAKVAVADSDAVDSPAKQKELIEGILNGPTNVIIGTQMMAKGHHFPNLTLVGVIDGDMGLTRGDLRAAEKTFQLVTQVAGRAGREKKGKVMVQTHQPEHALFQALKVYDRDSFYTQELASRKEWGDPPFGRLVAIIVSGGQENLVKTTAQKLVQGAPKQEGVQILGPAPAPMAKLRDRYRYRLLVKSQKPLQAYVKGWIEQVKIPPKIRVVVDVDPQSFV